MKTIAACGISCILASSALAQQGTAPAVTDPTKQPAFLSGRQLDVVCAHVHSGTSETGSTVLYRAQEIDADKLAGKIRIGRLTAIVVRFTHVNTFCFDYEAGVTKQLTFYAGNMPAQLKNFFIGGLSPVFIPAGVQDTFLADQGVFKKHYDSYGSLGDLTIDIRKAFSSSIDPKEDNGQIREAVRTNLRKVFGFTNRDVTKEDLTIRQGELEAGLSLLTKDLAQLRADADPTNQTDMGLIAKDEDAVSMLTGQLDNYATAITDLAQVQAAPDTIERVVLLDSHYDEYVVTAAVALLKPKPTESDAAVTPTTTSSSLTIDITGGPQLDFSAGIVATHPVSHDYFLQVSGASKIVRDGGAPDPSFIPAVFVHLYTRPAPGQFAIGPTFGVDVSTGQNFFFGLGLTRAGPQRFSLVGGFSLNRLTVLNGDEVGEPAQNGLSIQTKVRYVGGYFLGLTFNLGG